MPQVLVRPNVRVPAARCFPSASAPRHASPPATYRPRHASAGDDRPRASQLQVSPTGSRLRMLLCTATEIRQWQLTHGTPRARSLR
jgi:hypothetical protein